jgi:hypothetical protein
MSAFAQASARQSTLPLSTRAQTGGKGIRTPGLLIANETLYQLSYTPLFTYENRVGTFHRKFDLHTDFLQT